MWMRLGSLELRGSADDISHHLESVEGLGGPAWRMASDARVAADGQILYVGFRDGIELVLRGRTVCASELAMMAALDELDACLPRTGAVLVWASQAGQRHLLVRPVQWARDLVGTSIVWSVTVRSESAVWFAGDGTAPGMPESGWLSGSAGLQGSTPGGFAVPLIPPWSSSATSQPDTVCLVNPGTSGLVEIRLRGPLSAPRVDWRTKSAAGFAQWPTLNLEVGQWLSWRTGEDPLLMGQSPRWPAAASTLPAVEPGEMTVWLSGSSPEPTSNLLTVGLLPGYGG